MKVLLPILVSDGCNEDLRQCRLTFSGKKKVNSLQVRKLGLRTFPGTLSGKGSELSLVLLRRLQNPCYFLSVFIFSLLFRLDS